MEYHVSKNGNDKNAGSASAPFKTISRAAVMAMPGDTVIVHEGEYRECVSPLHGGHSDRLRITYTAAEGEHVVIKGSEVLAYWSNVKENIWRAYVDNSVFKKINPYEEIIEGDWLMTPVDNFRHTGEVYLNGSALSETASDKMAENTWRAEVKDNITEIRICVSCDPNDELVEINVRRSCFYPENTGVNYITVRGFEMTQAATPWAPPTADQPGLIGTHWSKGWIIENNIIHDAKCSAVSIGKEISTGHNPYTQWHRKSGYQYQLETVFRAEQSGWSREKVGSHIIRNNTIYDCGQNGIVGNLGCIFSSIYNNHIYNIGNRHEFFGYEIAGVKLHAAIDLELHDNLIHNCRLGTWLDWQAQGARVSRNIYYGNERDFWIEVTHGPYIMDNNIFGSADNITNNAQGGAYIHNLFCGRIQRYDIRNRSTPYHLPHSTKLAGCAQVYGGDDRYYNNIFCGTDEETDDLRHKWNGGTSLYNGSTVSLDEYKERVLSHGRGDIETFECERQPVYIDSNCYLSGAVPFEREEHPTLSDNAADARIYREDDGIYLEITFPDSFRDGCREIVNSAELMPPRICEAPYEDREGKTIIFNMDMQGSKRRIHPAAGPLEYLKPGMNRIKIR